ncbi:LAMI_0E11056g1_1 [Lachancea mirantina]|uniref:LAMI_0E11056g1_1 n=1 Tax=Lachancea mirantina TaxID=1230905 RepID=A0A1G4JPP6_9SACH|nr:LAMI_0E11056g1_1 [Lachancea mirantina]
MSDYEALLQFNRERVSLEMVNFLAATTSSIIQTKESSSDVQATFKRTPRLVDFIKGLVSQSNVQTPTLMSTAVYLARLRAIIPGSVYGIESTRHRIFLGCLIIAAKSLNDSSPLNKHWASYTGGLLDVRDVNTIERELLEYFDWNLQITTRDLLTCLAPFLQPIKEQLVFQKQQSLIFNPALSDYFGIKTKPEAHSRSSSNMSIPSLASTATLSSISSMESRRTPLLANTSRTMQCIAEETSEHEIQNRTKPQLISSALDSHGKNASDSSLKVAGSKRAPDRLTRPIILKTGLSKPVHETHITTTTKKFGLRSNWTSIFK